MYQYIHDSGVSFACPPLEYLLCCFVLSQYPPMTLDHFLKRLEIKRFILRPSLELVPPVFYCTHRAANTPESFKALIVQTAIRHVVLSDKFPYLRIRPVDNRIYQCRVVLVTHFDNSSILPIV